MSIRSSKPALFARRSRSTSDGGEPTRVPLRLIASNGGLGIELYEEQQLGLLKVQELRWSLPGLSFPVDLSGGVRAFRHRRGRLEQMTVGIELEEVSTWLAKRLKGMLGGLQEPPRVWLVPCGVAVGLSAAQGAVAFELLWAPTEDCARWVVADARCGGFPGPALGHALQVVDTAFGKRAERHGRVIELPALPSKILRDWLPEIGVRSPDARGLKFSDFEVCGDSISVSAGQTVTPYALPEPTVRALELARLTRAADDALFAGHLDQARADYVSALERAPRHPELCQLIASIDLHYRERAEAALGLLVESLPATSFGMVGAELLAGVGDVDGAHLAVSRQANGETYSPLAALWWLRLSSISSDLRTQREALDQALAACASSEPARVARFRLRVASGDINGALADAEHLEANARGSTERHKRIVSAAAHLLEFGYVGPAGKMFERALRYLPKDAEATLGLAEALLASQRPERALVLLERTVELSEGNERLRSKANLSLAKLLAEFYRDLPQAIARAREVTGNDSVALEARALEALFRARIGDLVGANLSYARLRDCVELSGIKNASLGAWLVEAAKHSLEISNDLHAAERHLAVALRVSPQDPTIQALYREVAGKLLGAPASSGEKSRASSSEPNEEFASPGPDPASAPEVEKPLEQPWPAEISPAHDGSDEVPKDSDAYAQLEQRASALIAQLMAAPESSPAIPELCEVLGRLERFEQLYALLQARFEDAEREQQESLLPHLRRALEGLVKQHSEQGSLGDAELYGQLLEGLDR